MTGEKVLYVFLMLGETGAPGAMHFTISLFIYYIQLTILRLLEQLDSLYVTVVAAETPVSPGWQLLISIYHLMNVN